MGQIGECERNRPALRLVHYSDACWKDGGGYGSTYRLASNQCTYTMHMHIPIYTLIPGSRGSQENNVRDRDALSALDGGREPHCGGLGARAQETRRTYPTHMRKQRATGIPGDENKDSQVSTTCQHCTGTTRLDGMQSSFSSHAQTRPQTVGSGRDVSRSASARGRKPNKKPTKDNTSAMQDGEMMGVGNGVHDLP